MALLRWEYLLSGLGALAGVALLDRALGTGLLQQGRFWLFQGVMLACTILFDGYLTARPVTLYDPCCHLGPRLVTIPPEDLLFGAALVGLVVVLWEWGGRRFGTRAAGRDTGAAPGGGAR